MLWGFSSLAEIMQQVRFGVKCKEDELSEAKLPLMCGGSRNQTFNLPVVKQPQITKETAFREHELDFFLPGNERLLPLPLDVVPLLLVVIVIFEAAVFSIALLGPVAVVVVGAVVVAIPGPGSGPGPGAAPTGTPDAESSDVSRLFETTFPLLSLPLLVAGLREFGPKAVRRQATLSATVSAAGSSTGSPGPRTRRVPAAVGAGPVRQRHPV